ncbi:MAG TPA: hypothetical protein VGV09_02060 [Steroidobacteraceae bacterium]|nr:hypothetical protein [Steroidobacteraceae bacterium]
MDDEFMYLGVRKPRPALLREVRERLRGLEETRRAPRSRWGLRLLACAASLALVVSLSVVPSMRVGAQAFLDLFRVVNFVALRVPNEHFADRAREQGLDLPRMLAEQIKVLKAPSPPVSVASPEEAGMQAGMRVLVPTWLPADLHAQAPQVVGERAVSVTVSSQKLQRVEAAFGIDDLPVPGGIDGKTADIYTHPAVLMLYTGDHRQVQLVESRQPQVSLPEGLDLARLAEIGLRVIGMNSADAYQFAQQIDWRTTLVVPVPADAFDLQQVDVQGSHGLLIRRRVVINGAEVGQAQLLWSTADAVFALSGGAPQELLNMARSMQ